MGVDIRPYKTKLRKKYRAYREGLSPEEKRALDGRIFDRLQRLEEFDRAGLVAAFVSTPIEVDTHRLIHACWRAGKKLALPKCLDERGKMAFFLVSSWADLAVGRFSLWEPDPERCPPVTDWADSVCIVPGFSFDRDGYRLGFGKGYYDRFLSGYSGVKIGLCYHRCLAYRLPRGRYDVPVDYLITEKTKRRIGTGR